MCSIGWGCCVGFVFVLDVCSCCVVWGLFWFLLYGLVLVILCIVWYCWICSSGLVLVVGRRWCVWWFGVLVWMWIGSLVWICWLVFCCFYLFGVGYGCSLCWLWLGNCGFFVGLGWYWYWWCVWCCWWYCYVF